MFTNLIESDSHRKEFKRRSSFFLVTVTAYSVIVFAAGVVSIMAYDARLESQTNSLEVLSWIPPATTTPKADPPRNIQPTHRVVPSTAPVDQHISIPERVNPNTTTSDPRQVPDAIATSGSNSETVIGPVNIGTRDANPPGSSEGGCPTCNGPGNATIARVETPKPTPEPVVVKRQIERLPTQILMSKVISLPQPPYPTIARQNRISGVIPVQILIDENGKVVSAHAVSGSPFLTSVAESAAKRASFTPTILNGAPVKVQGVITYNFVLQ
jgi:protein TonB